MTGMALLCLLRTLRTAGFTRLWTNRPKAINFLTSTPPDKPVGAGNTGSYSHPIRTYALCEAYTMTKIKKLEEFAKGRHSRYQGTK